MPWIDLTVLGWGMASTLKSMFGTYRLVLACLVALSHFGLIIAGFNPGQWAVICFYVLSGFLMERQFQKLASAKSFFLDRFFRIYPVYASILILSAVLLKPSLLVSLNNFLLIPLNYGYFTGVPALVGPAWSLACEVQFYLLVPLFFLLSTRIIRCIAFFSAILFCISPLLSNSVFWSYLGLPGILFTFLSGILIARKDFSHLRIAWIASIILLAIFSYLKHKHPNLSIGININVCIGYIAALFVMAKLSPLSPLVAWDKLIGMLSYPLFLVHGLVKEFFERFSTHPNMLLLLVYSLAAAALLSLFIEKPFDRIRYKLRKAPRQKSPKVICG